MDGGIRHILSLEVEHSRLLIKNARLRVPGRQLYVRTGRNSGWDRYIGLGPDDPFRIGILSGGAELSTLCSLS